MQEGKFYFIKDIYFEKFKDPFLMHNHEETDGKRHDRPCFYAIKDKDNSQIFWMVPLSTKIDKYQKVYDYNIKKRGYCDLVLIAPFFKHSKSAFLFQNIFPVTEKYIANKYVDAKNNDIVLRKDVEREVFSLARRVLVKHNKGFHNIYPDIDKIKKLLENEL